MSLDVVEFFLSLEDLFGIRLTESETQAETLQRLTRSIAARMPRERVVCLTERVLSRVRVGLVREGVENERGLSWDVPGGAERALTPEAWRSISRGQDFALPKVESPAAALVGSSSIFVLVSFLLVFALWKEHADLAVFLVLLVGVLAFAAERSLVRRFCLTPYGVVSMGDLAGCIVALNFRELSKGLAEFSDSDVYEVIRWVFAQKFSRPLTEVSGSTRIPGRT